MFLLSTLFNLFKIGLVFSTMEINIDIPSKNTILNRPENNIFTNYEIKPVIGVKRKRDEE
jgi:hypothetical protein